MKASSGKISIERSAKRIDVDNRISLRYYYRIADNLIRQANIYREEKNIIDLYVMLLRFSSLITETIPSHQDYKYSLQSEKLYFKKKLLNALTELETLKPAVQRRLEELNRNSKSQANGWVQSQQNGFVDDSSEWPLVKTQMTRYHESSQVQRVIGQNGFSQGPITQRVNLPLAKTKQEQFHRSLNIPRPKEETLLRHSILGPNGLHGQWQPTITNLAIQYPSNLDFTPVEIPSSLLQPTQNKPADTNDSGTTEHDKTPLEEVLSLHDAGLSVDEQSRPMATLDIAESLAKIDISREPSPPPVRAEVQDLIAVTSEVSDSNSSQTIQLQDELIRAQAPVQVHISTTMMDSFMRFAKSNTDRNLETCGILAGSLKNRIFYLTALVIPKQESTSDSCQTTNEEEVFDYLDKNSLFSLGWIHTHPTQSCFMSSIDLHTHYSYQVLLPEAIAIVMAPKDSSRNHGIFRLTTPGGMSVIKQCPQRGFHPHQQPSDGGPLYDHCSDVYMVPKLKFDVVDLR
ncbi:AMSH-like ubiquitin thioesterase 1 isoform X1 [Typha angustifolia]|uniref:AMSH-like ubiquitin thioesterase 1 isoform X1 n=1 Tax=Typha angustifolia TaxID=59011 RepID=UPI003C2F4AE7